MQQVISTLKIRNLNSKVLMARRCNSCVRLCRISVDNICSSTAIKSKQKQHYIAIFAADTQTFLVLMFSHEIFCAFISYLFELTLNYKFRTRMYYCTVNCEYVSLQFYKSFALLVEKSNIISICLFSYFSHIEIILM